MKIEIQRQVVYLIIVLVGLSSCKVYKQDILFQLDEDFTESDLVQPIFDANSNYQLAPNDYITLDVFTNDGERIIDPNNELAQGNNRTNQRQRFDYLIQSDGTVRLPIVGQINIEGLTIIEAEKVLQQSYNELYKDSFVKVAVSNRRVIVLGGTGGQVITLDNENMTIAEVLALYGGVQMGLKANNIRLIRGDLSDPEVFQIDLTTITGLKSSSLIVMPGDIIYVEPWRRPWLQTLRDVSPVLSITSSVIAFVLVIQNLVK